MSTPKLRYYILGLLNSQYVYKRFFVFFLRSGDELKNGSSNSSSNITNGENGANNGVNSITAQLRRQHMAEIVFGDNTEKSAAVGNPSGGARILSFKSKAPTADEGHLNNLKVPEYENATIVLCLNTLLAGLILHWQAKSSSCRQHQAGLLEA